MLCISLLETRQPHGRRKSTCSLGPSQQASLHHHCCNCLNCQLAAIVLGLRIPRVMPQNGSLTNVACRRGLLCISLLETRQPHGRRKSTSAPGPGKQASLHHHQCCNCFNCKLSATVLGLRIPRVVHSSAQNEIPKTIQNCSLTNVTRRPGLLCISLLETRQPHGRRKSTSSPGPS